MNSSTIGYVLRVACVASTLVAGGCASSPPIAKFARSSDKVAVIHRADTASIAVDAASGVTMADFEKDRLGERIKMKLAEKQAFNATLPAPSQYQIDVTVTRYEKGSAFARAMLAGLGQIHIDGNVHVYAMPSHDRLEEFTV